MKPSESDGGMLSGDAATHGSAAGVCSLLSTSSAPDRGGGAKVDGAETDAFFVMSKGLEGSASMRRRRSWYMCTSSAFRYFKLSGLAKGARRARVSAKER